MILETDVESRMRDGVILRADVYRPADDAIHPVLLSRTPYDKATVQHLDLMDPRVAVSRGYVVILQDVRGRFASSGRWLPWAHEATDGFDSVAWAASLPYSDGQVAMWGASYVGNTQWRAAISGPPALRAIAPAVTWATPTDGLFERGGVPEHGLNITWALQTGRGELQRRGGSARAVAQGVVELHDSLPNGGYSSCPPGRVPLLEQHDVPDSGVSRYLADSITLQEREVLGLLESARIPAFHIGGWYDIFLQGTLENFKRQRVLGVASRLVVGPWAHGLARSLHGGARDFGSAAEPHSIGLRASLADLQLDFFDAQLRQPAADDGGAAVRIFVMGINQWRDEEDWPIARARPRLLYLRASGALTDHAPSDGEAPDVYEFDADSPAPTVGGATEMHPAFVPGARAQRDVETRDDVLCYTSEPLGEDLEVTGPISATIYALSSASSADWVARLCDVQPDGTSVTLVDGIVRSDSDELTHLIDLWSTSVVFQRGHRIRLQITSSSFPRWAINPDMAATAGQLPIQTVYHDPARPSHITLPVVPPRRPLV